MVAMATGEEPRPAPSDILRWRDPAGVVRSFGVGDQLPTRRLATGTPWSVPLRSQHHRSRSGAYYFVGVRRHIAFASLAEASLLLLLDFQQSVARILSQPFQLTFVRGARRIKHVPDYFMEAKSGEQGIWNARPDDLIDDKLAEKSALTREFCASVGFAYYLFNGVDMAVRRNLEWLHAYASDRYAPRAQEREQLREFFSRQDRTIHAAIADLQAPPECVRMWTFHMLWHRELMFEVDVPLNDFVTIQAAE